MNVKNSWVGGMAQVKEHLPNKQTAMISKASTDKN
jgi:hypothetical protein